MKHSTWVYALFLYFSLLAKITNMYVTNLFNVRYYQSSSVGSLPDMVLLNWPGVWRSVLS